MVAGSERIRFVEGDERIPVEPLRPLSHGTVAILSGMPLDYPMATTFPFVHRIHAALSQGLLARGLNPFLMVGGANQASRAANLQPVACVVLDDAFGLAPDYQAVLAPLMVRGIPLIVQSDRLPDTEAATLDLVRCDHRSGAAALTRLLAARNRRRLIATFPEWLGATPQWIGEREQGIREACAALRLAPPSIIRLSQLIEVADPDLRFQRLVRVATGFLHEHLCGATPADALLIASDGEVAPAATACRFLGRTPGSDLDLVGFDDYWRGIPERRYECYLPEASMDRDGTHVGLALAKLVAQRLAEPLTPACLHLVQPRFVSCDQVEAPRATDDDPHGP